MRAHAKHQSDSLHRDFERLAAQRISHPVLSSDRLQAESFDPKHVSDLWLHRESDFKFLEAMIGLSDPLVARELLMSLKELDRLFTARQEVREARALDQLDQLPEHFYEATESSEELDWVETLFEEELLDEDDPQVLEFCLAEARALKWLLVEALCAEHQLSAALEPMESSQPIQADPQAIWCGEQRLRAPTFDRTTRRSALSSEAMISASLQRLLAEGCASIEERELTWVERCQSRALDLPPSFWRSELLSIASQWAAHHLITQLMKAASEDIADVFELLAIAERPRDHRVGALTFGGDRGEDVTIIFTKRDGHILAQRQVKWDPDQPALVCDAFKEIKIRTLVAPDQVSPAIEQALVQLCDNYQVARVSDLGTVEVKRPHNLTQEAQVALQLAQRYVAPLRYWARADLFKIAEVSLEPALYEQLASDERWRWIYSDTLKARVDSAWVRLRSLRQHRADQPKRATPSEAQTPPSGKGRSAHTPPQGAPHRSSVSGEVTSMRRGDLVDITLTEVTPFRLIGEVSSGPRGGREVLITLSGSRELIDKRYEVGQRLQACVIHDHPKQPHAHLTLRSLGSGAAELDPHHGLKGRRAPSAPQHSSAPQRRAASASRSSTSQSAERETLKTLNSLFKKSPR